MTTEGNGMHAQPGDWLIVNSRTEGRPVRRAVILAVHSQGEPPYTVRWTNTDHEALVFPGPDAQVISAEKQAELDRAAERR
jgi:leucyl aminopeptidase (aminopeptidase T)